MNPSEVGPKHTRPNPSKRNDSAMSFWKAKQILVTGGAGFLGSALVEELKRRGAENVVVPRSETCDLRIRENCRKIVRDIDIVVHLAAKAGGIGLNMAKPGELFFDNLIMGCQLMEEARLAGVQKFVAIGTICAYPKFSPTPFREENLWDGYPEETSAPYGLAKKMLLVQSQAYRQQYEFNSVYLLPVNLYGPRDNFDLETSHVITALIRKFVEARDNGHEKVTLWGDGSPTREFLYVDDAALGIALAAEKYNKPDPVNLGSGSDISIKSLAELISRIVGYEGKVIWDTSKPNGQPKRRMDTSKATQEFCFQANTSLEEGLRRTVKWYEENRNRIT